ncbi:hypothetical protein ACMGGR_00505 [Erwinia sp. BNK-24-b]|uniref:hypothetical protein n=1 Tax=unclassified Erwinia TaxID=2622719 RepID=UPI0039BF43D0
MATIEKIILTHLWIRIVGCCLIVLAVIFTLCRIYISVAVEEVYSDLAQPGETEAPSTFTTYPSSQNTEAIIGGRGTGLNCSIPYVMKKIAFKTVKEGSDISLRFRQACVMHDLCYRHGFATYGYTQNDCDTRLQQSAYRLCRQIGSLGRAKINVPLSDYSICEHEAKEVLMGVTLGGAGSYHGKGSSTWFEYDPQPATADSYIVGRAVPGGVVSDPGKDYGVRTFYFRRNTVKMRVLAATPESNDVNALPFPGALVATPPLLTGMVEGDNNIYAPPLVSLARNSFSETSVHLIPFVITRQNVAGKASHLLSIPPCSDKGSDACTLDADASINKFALIDNKPTLISLTHRGVLSSNKTTVEIGQRAFMQNDGAKSEYFLNGPTAPIHNQYRFLAHDMLLERDLSGRVTHAWAFARGVQVSADGKQFVRDDSGKDYSVRVAVARQQLGAGHAENIQRFSLQAKETDEPLSLVRLGSGKGMALVGLAWSDDDLSRVESDKPAEKPPLLKIWRLPQNGMAPDPAPQVLSLPLPIPNGYIGLAPVIARLSTQDAPLLVLTRVAPDSWRNDENQPKPSVTMDTLAVNFVIASLVSNGDRPLSFASNYQLRCEIALNKQLQSPEAHTAKQRAYRTLFGYYSAALEARNPAWQIDSIKSDLAQRWRMSQVIVSERRLEKEGAVLALTMVFNGFPAMSFQVLLKEENGRLRYLPSDTLPGFLNGCALNPLPSSRQQAS